jgi:glycosyltransferase involved in cell wall biosynthesis
MRVHVYTLTWNEEAILPYFLQHYASFAERIVVYDNCSDDQTRFMVDQHPAAELRALDAGGELREDLTLEMKNEAWKELCGTGVDYVAIVDADEFLYHKDLLGFLRKNRRYSLFRTLGFQMVSESFPCDDDSILKQVVKGCHREGMSKCVLFDPDMIEDINYLPGAHKCAPSGDVVKYESSGDLKLLHYKWLGVEYVCARHSEYKERLSALNREHGWGKHYYANRETIEAIYRDLIMNCEVVLDHT